jgi:hypothetical protein
VHLSNLLGSWFVDVTDARVAKRGIPSLRECDDSLTQATPPSAAHEPFFHILSGLLTPRTLRTNLEEGGCGGRGGRRGGGARAWNCGGVEDDVLRETQEGRNESWLRLRGAGHASLPLPPEGVRGSLLPPGNAVSGSPGSSELEEAGRQEGLGSVEGLEGAGGLAGRHGGNESWSAGKIWHDPAAREPSSPASSWVEDTGSCRGEPGARLARRLARGSSPLPAEQQDRSVTGVTDTPAEQQDRSVTGVTDTSAEQQDRSVTGGWSAIYHDIKRLRRMLRSWSLEVCVFRICVRVCKGVCVLSYVLYVCASVCISMCVCKYVCGCARARVRACACVRVRYPAHPPPLFLGPKP